MAASPLRQQGYVVLMTVLIVGAAATAIGLTMLSIGTDAARSGLVGQQFKQARVLASACAQEALQTIHDNVAYSGTTNLSMGQGTCSYTVAIATPTTRTVTASGTVGTVKRKIQSSVTVNASTLTTSTWQEVSNTYSAILQVQNMTFTNDAAATTIVQTFQGNTTAGNLIVAALTWDTSTSGSVTCSDNKSDSFTTVNIWNDTTNTQALAICYAPNVAGGTTTVTATLSGTGGAFRRMVISEYSGVATSSPVDVSVGQGGINGTTTANAITSGTATPTLNGDLIYAAVEDTGTATTIAAGTTSNFTQRAFTNNKDFAVEDFQQSTAATVAGTWTFGTAQRYDAAMVAFKAATQ